MDIELPFLDGVDPARILQAREDVADNLEALRAAIDESSVEVAKLSDSDRTPEALNAIRDKHFYGPLRALDAETKSKWRSVATAVGGKSLVYSALNFVACSWANWPVALGIAGTGAVAAIDAIRELRDLAERRKESPAYLLWRLKTSAGTYSEESPAVDRSGLPPGVHMEMICQSG